LPHRFPLPHKFWHPEKSQPARTNQTGSYPASDFKMAPEKQAVQVFGKKKNATGAYSVDSIKKKSIQDR